MTMTAGVSYSGACPERSRRDVDGKRVKKSNGTLYWYGGGSDVLYETDLGGINGHNYVFFGGHRLARFDETAQTIYHYFEDHLGSSKLIIQSTTNTPCYDADFGPYGKDAPVTDTCAQNYKFTGKERDTETGNDYFGARFYENNLGRWISPDKPLADQHSANPQTWNLYSYTRNNPVAFIDPDGKAVQTMTTLALQRIQSTVPRDVRSQVTADKNGILNRKAIDAIKSSDPNVMFLKQAVDSTRTIEVTTAPALQGGQPKGLVNFPFSYDSGADQKASVKAAGGDPSKVIPTLYLGVTQSADQSISGNVRVTLSDGTGAAAGAPESEQAVTAAHELYGHGLPNINGQPSGHDEGGPVDKNIRQIEDHTRKLNEEPK